VRSTDTDGRMIRQHWHIENQLHWSLDVTCNEDRSRMRKDHAAENMASLRRVALNRLRHEPSRQISLRQIKTLM
jgi:predicted transposase YbfD/YdcC